MTESFPNSPLIELSVEVRWDNANPQEEQEDGRAYVSRDAFMDRFARSLAQIGFVQSERLLPPGMDAGGEVPTFRFTNPSQDPVSVVYYVGPGGFNVSAVQPYVSWDKFRPRVEEGLQLLLASMDSESGPTTFSSVSLNYIDSFDERFWGGRTRYEFVTEVLGFALALPEPLAALITKDGKRTAFADFGGVDEHGRHLAVRAGLASVSNEDSVVLDIKLTDRRGVNADALAIVASLDSSRDLIHEAFIGLTLPIREIMRGTK